MKYSKLIEQYRSKKTLPSQHVERRQIEDRLFNALVGEFDTLFGYNRRTKVRKALKPIRHNDSWAEPEWIKALMK